MCLLLKRSRVLYEIELNRLVTLRFRVCTLLRMWLCCTSHALQTAQSAPHIEPITYLLPYLSWQYNNVHASRQEEWD